MFPGASDGLKIFISYSHKDAKYKDRLETHLRVLENIAPLETWADTCIDAGQDWRREIDHALTESAAAVLLVTADFLASKFIATEEVPKILTRRKEEGLIVFSIIARSCPWKLVSWLESMQVRPGGDAKPVWRSGGRYVEDELTLITYEIAEVVKAANLKSHIEREGSVEKAQAKLSLAPKMERIAQEVQQNRLDLLSIQTVNEENLKERWKILQDTQRKIFDIQSEVLANRALTQDAMFNKWEEYIRS